MYWSGRAGTLAVAQFPLITALGTKNNVIACELYSLQSCTRCILTFSCTDITGVSYDKVDTMYQTSLSVR